MTALPLLDIEVGDYGEHEAAMVAFRRQGTRRALALDNRGPIRYDQNGKVSSEIVDSYNQHGFYVLTGVVGEDELAEIEADVADMLDRAPTQRGSTLDRHGRKALGVGLSGRNVVWVKPLSDPLGGTDASYGRHEAKMIEPVPPTGAPDHVVQLILGSLQFSDACLRMYGHPDLLGLAEAIHGPDFTPFNEGVWVKHPGLGGSVAWHQDGWTHWDDPEVMDANTHGFNFMLQLYGCDAANGLWVVPGSHQEGKVDIKSMVDDAGSDRLDAAVPLICGPGDVAITNRQAVHGSFANTSPNVRVTINMGFHRRSSVLNVRGGGVHNPVSVYDDDYIFERSKAIAYAIDARAQHRPNENRFVYEPFVGLEDQYRWDSDTRFELQDYNLRDIGI